MYPHDVGLTVSPPAKYRECLETVFTVKILIESTYRDAYILSLLTVILFAFILSNLLLLKFRVFQRYCLKLHALINTYFVTLILAGEIQGYYLPRSMIIFVKPCV